MKQTIQLSEIKVDDRQREDYGDIPDLALSLADERFGQLAPIRLDRSNKLVAGGRRVAAAAVLANSNQTIAGLEAGTIWFEYIDTISPEHAKEIELEENLRRKDLSMPEQQKAIADLHALKVARDPDWNADKTAAMIGKSRRTVYNAVELSKAFEKNPELAKADTAQGAMMRLNRIKDLSKREDDIRVAVMAKGLGYENKTEAKVLHMDALDGMKETPSESVDGVIFNPPFGVDIESLFTTDKKIYSNDDPHDMTSLVDQIVKEAYRILKPDRWMVMFYPTVRLEDVKGIGPAMWQSILDAINRFQDGILAQREIALNFSKLREDLEQVCGGMLRRHGFNFQQVPAQWVKPNKRVSAMGDPYAQLNINYESFYFARKGKALLRKIPPSNTFIVDTPSADRIHPLEMPVDLWETILAAICVAGERIVEPFAGSGSGGEAAIRLGINYTGWELDGEFALHGNTRLVGALAGALSKPKSMASGTTTESAGPLRLMRNANGTITIDTTQLDDNVFEDE